MIPNNNISALPFYDSLDKQNHRKDYAFGEIFTLASPDRKILPFQIIRETSGVGIVNVILRAADGTYLESIKPKMIDTGLVVNRYESDGFDVIMYPGILPMDLTLPEGRYYLELNDGATIWYSEIFTTIRNLDNYLKIEYWDAESIEVPWGLIDYSIPFKWIVYLPTQLGRPDYEFEEQVTKRDGYQFIEKQISEKTFKFNFVAPEYLLDALRIIRMCDYIQITNKGDVYTVDQFLITPKWQDGGYLAAVEAEFQCDTVIKKIGRGYTPANNGDFNNDFNNDFNIS